jgi:hypothetical protein
VIRLSPAYKRFFRAAIIVAGVALFARSLGVIGLERIVSGIARVGWGFGVIVILSGVREVLRTLAWTRTVEGAVPLRFLPALRARLAGEALNALLPMGMVVGEPAKASHVGSRIPFATAFRGLVAEFAFYTASLVLLFGAGVSSWIVVEKIRVGPVVSLGLIAAAVIAAIVGVRLRWTRGLRDIVFGFAFRHPEHVGAIAAYEIGYQVLAVAEIYVTLLLVSPVPPTLASALILETVNRAITIAFKILPMRIGIDEVSSSLFASRLDLGSATGLTLALVRKLRMLFWSAIGLALLPRRPSRTAASVARANPAFLGLAVVLTLMAASAAAAQSPPASVSGTVSVADPGGQPLVVPGVTLTLTCAGGDPRVEVSNERGEFRFADVAVASGPCSIAADLQGFKSATEAVALEPGRETSVTLQLGFNTLREEVTVSAKADLATESPIAGRVDRITTQVMRTAPIASERFQDALPLIPGVVRGPDGLLNINGTRSNQSGLMFNSANGTDPVTGEDAIELPIDAVSSVQVRGAAYAPEFGLSAGAVTTVETQKAGDAWHVTLNDLEPRVRRRGGKFKGIESFTPRVTVGGPIVAGKLSLLESVQYEFSQTRVFGLPPFESDTKLQSLASFSRADWIVSPTNHFTASAMVSPRKTTFAGLNTFNPQPVTPNIKNDNVLASASDQIIVGSRGVLDTRVSVKQFNSTIYPSQGDGPMILAPNVNAGSYFNDQDRTSRRAEWLTTYSLTPLGPMHLLKIGAGVTRELFDGVSTNRPVQIVRADGTLSQSIGFAGGGQLDRNKTALLGYAQDTWTAGSRLTLQYGARYDYESVTGDVNVAPRGSFTAVVTSDGRTVVRGGAGMFYNALPLNVATFDELQRRIVTSFAGDGVTPLGPAVELPNVVASELRAPRSVNWNLEVDREWVKNLFVRVGYQQRENRFDPVVDAADGAIVLRADGRSRYREGQISGRYQFHGTDQIVGSYTRSSAIGNLNDFNSFFGNIENPVIRPDERGPLPWDAPNRVLLWSSVSLPRGFAVFPVLDVRTGFPLSNVDADRNFVGPRNEAGRFPRFVSLDAQLTKKLRLFNHNATIGLKVFNITDHFNPRDYQGNLASDSFGDFNNSVGRTFRGKWIFEF